jgi:hypothetical protein
VATLHLRDPKDVLTVFFGESSSKKLHLPKFRAHLQSLHANIVAAEFRHYDVSGRGWISGTDLARSIVTPADVRRVDALLDKVGAAAWVGGGRRWRGEGEAGRWRSNGQQLAFVSLQARLDGQAMAPWQESCDRLT